MNNAIFKTTPNLLEQLANDLLLISQSNKTVHISLSGGSTPNLLFDYLARSNYAKTINWQQLHFWWGDERCVDKEDPESNYGQCKKRLFDHIDIPAENIHRIRGENPPAEEVIRYAKELKAVIPHKDNIPEFDWIILGMGEDGHTASIFPEQYAGEDEQLTFIATQPQTGQLRISKTGYLIEQSKRITYLVIGENKAEMIRLINTQPINSQKYPAAYIASKTGMTEFYLDHQAAKKLEVRV